MDPTILICYQLYHPVIDDKVRACNCNVLSIFLLYCWVILIGCLQCFDTVGWASGRASGIVILSGVRCKWFALSSSWCHCHPIHFLHC